jgi:Icc protein
MLIAQISDTHIGSEGVNGQRAEIRLAQVRRCVAHINRLDPQPDLILHTGDMTHGGWESDYARVKEVLDDLKAPLAVVPGNRDESQAMIRAFGLAERVNGFIQYALDDYPVRLVAVDTKNESSPKTGWLCDKRLTQLDDLLSEASEKPTALFMHHPPFDIKTSNDPFSFESREQCDALAEVLRHHPQVIHVFCGHSHRPYFDRLAGVPANTVPALSVDLQRGQFDEREAQKPLYMLHRWNGADRFNSETVIVE